VEATAKPLPSYVALAVHLVRYLHFEINFHPGGFMKILAAIKREERKLEKQLGKLQRQLNGVRAAAKALGDSTNREIKGMKKRVMSAAARAKIGRAAKKRWAKFRAQAKKVAG
jgi:hypothetical protein